MCIHRLEGSVRNKDCVAQWQGFKLSESYSRIEITPNPFQNQSKLRTGEFRKGLDSWLENMEAETIASRPLALAPILDIAGKLERLSVVTSLQLHPCSWISDRKRTTDHTKSTPLFLLLISRFCSANAHPCSSYLRQGVGHLGALRNASVSAYLRGPNTEHISQNRGSVFSIDSWFLPYCRFCI
ncbi:hypothetical protein DFH08DRAFT_290898 [Mycena albidolilacea]|uniref:Uncharacterized protein n=1 Tax=Mycena albidolilacea TaxID=1033008 RepID=A0AAD6ZS13_9AGAR|nr:hypothetical protein DFH08DRAFT_290898 [Mycena albidolilacea]